jgi:NitT/TauT family transport system permease protein
LAELIASGELPRAYLSTLQPLALGVAMGLWRRLEWLAAPLFIVMQAAPMAAVIPLVTFVYGIGLTSKVIAVCIMAMPVIVLNSFGAARNASPSLVPMCRATSSSPARPPASRPSDAATGCTRTSTGSATSRSR